MPNTKKLSIPEKAVRRKKPGFAGSAKRIAAYRAGSASKSLCAAGNALGNLRTTMHGMGLDELLSVSEYISQIAHGEHPRPTTLTSDQARECIKMISEMPSDDDKYRAIAMLNTQIVVKNRASVNMHSAERAYAEFIRTD